MIKTVANKSLISTSLVFESGVSGPEAVITIKIPMMPKTIDAQIKIRVAIFCMNLVYHGLMTKKEMVRQTHHKLSGGIVHKIPADVRKVFASAPRALATWEDITPLARNEWICWIESAKQSETRKRRIRIAIENLSAGKRRPCCWAGCIHR